MTDPQVPLRRDLDIDFQWIITHQKAGFMKAIWTDDGYGTDDGPVRDKLIDLISRMMIERPISE